jgi:DNA-binding winged helix-turn-helix (wHTH) protein
VATEADTVVGVPSIPEALSTIQRLVPDIVILDPDAEESLSDSRRLTEACAAARTAVVTVVRPAANGHAGPAPPGFAEPLVEESGHRDEGRGALPPVARMGRLTLHRDAGRIEGPGGSAYLTDMETRLLAYLLQRDGAIVPPRELLEQVWQHGDGGGSAGLVRAHIRNLRIKLRLVNPGAEVIRTFPRRGYAVTGTFRLPTPAEPVNRLRGSGAQAQPAVAATR